MKKIIISHFFNEEYLLPWFLNHHKQIFDHGIMIDYHSTDRSVEIIKEICPTWEIVISRNKDFQADNIDTEVMDIESQLDGWKIALNVTELMIGDYSILDSAPKQLLLPTVFMVDNDRENVVTYDKPLYEQKRWGFSFKDGQREFLERRARSIHNVPMRYPLNNTVECMGPGRHWHNYNTTELVIFYYGWSPLNEQGLARKLQIQTQIPLVDRQRGWGYHHITTKETLVWRLENEFLPRSRDLTEDINYYVNKHKSFSNLLQA